MRSSNVVNTQGACDPLLLLSSLEQQARVSAMTDAIMGTLPELRLRSMQQQRNILCKMNPSLKILDPPEYLLTCWSLRCATDLFFL